MVRRYHGQDWNLDPRAIARRKRRLKSVTKNGNYRAAVRTLRLALMERWDSLCQWDEDCNRIYSGLGHGKCNETDRDLLQFAHIHGKETRLKGQGRGSFERLKDVFDHPDSYVLLCAEHHREYDREK